MSFTVYQSISKNHITNLKVDLNYETSSISQTTHRSLPINVLSNLTDTAALASPLLSTSRNLSSSFIINGKIPNFNLIFLHILHI